MDIDRCLSTGGSKVVYPFTYKWLAEPVYTTALLERDTWVQLTECQTSLEHYGPPSCGDPALASTTEVVCGCQNSSFCGCTLWGGVVSHIQLAVGTDLPAAIGQRGCRILVSLVDSSSGGRPKLVSQLIGDFGGQGVLDTSFAFNARGVGVGGATSGEADIAYLYTTDPTYTTGLQPHTCHSENTNRKPNTEKSCH